ncbi:hypothetical protein Cgig2_012514 [Carnegiea gigantea]|uniref:Uncharacterized protein n=1 Tax=Carnegiea gigantea TaxID=171969 RepID=A0A9Q1K6D0_9CARY|nr:hypothetical protein Cgig2_012514 [Carnegiea gigantea]
MGKSTSSSIKIKCGKKQHDDHEEVMKTGPWSSEEDQKLIDFIRNNNGHPGNWRSLPKLAGIQRCGKSCRLRWANYLRPDIKRGPFSEEEDKKIQQLHALLGNRWAAIAARLPGRTDNDVKNYWNSHLKKRFKGNVKLESVPSESLLIQHKVQWESIRLETEARLSSEPLNRSLIPKTNCDHFLRLWHSEVGESFRCAGSGQAIDMGRVSSSPEGGSSTWGGSGSGITGQVEQPMSRDYFSAWRNWEQKPEKMDYSGGSDESGEFSDAAMNMLLDSPVSD